MKLPVEWAGWRTAKDRPVIRLPLRCLPFHTYILQRQIRGMCRTAEGVGHRVLSGMAVGAGELSAQPTEWQ